MVQWKERGALLSQDLLIVSKCNNVTGTNVGFFFNFFCVSEKYFIIKSDSFQRGPLYSNRSTVGLYHPAEAARMVAAAPPPTSHQQQVKAEERASSFANRLDLTNNI